jgi:hypothetical protein
LALHDQGAIVYRLLGVPSHETTDLAREISSDWDTLEELIQALLRTGLLWAEGAAGKIYLSLSDLGWRLVNSEKPNP